MGDNRRRLRQFLDQQNHHHHGHQQIQRAKCYKIVKFIKHGNQMLPLIAVPKTQTHTRSGSFQFTRPDFYDDDYSSSSICSSSSSASSSAISSCNSANESSSAQCSSSVNPSISTAATSTVCDQCSSINNDDSCSCSKSTSISTSPASTKPKSKRNNSKSSSYRKRTEKSVKNRKKKKKNNEKSNKIKKYPSLSSPLATKIVDKFSDDKSSDHSTASSSPDCHHHASTSCDDPESFDTEITYCSTCSSSSSPSKSSYSSSSKQSKGNYDTFVEFPIKANQKSKSPNQNQDNNETIDSIGVKPYPAEIINTKAPIINDTMDEKMGEKFYQQQKHQYGSDVNAISDFLIQNHHHHNQNKKF